MKPALLCISQSFAPETTPTAIRASKLLGRLAREWDVTVVTEAEGPHGTDGVRVETVRAKRPTRLFAALRRLRLDKLLELAVWPDNAIFWLPSAVLAGRRLIRERRPSAIVVFMMPYSAGLAGVALSRLTGLPLVLNLDDSPTCTDMHAYFPTRLHYRFSRALEDAYARWADAVVYVSDTNLAAVRERLPERVRGKLHLVRYGADRVGGVGDAGVDDAGVDDAGVGDAGAQNGSAEAAGQPPGRERAPQPAQRFEIAYVGAMSGWWALIEQDEPVSGPKRAFRAWTRLGRYEHMALDERTSSPAVIGRAIADAIADRPDWAGRVKLAIHGNPYPADVVARALAAAGVQDLVDVGGPVPHERVAQIVAEADLLFLTLPTRLDGSRGGRISAKTYEYLATDRPILAAVPRGENWDYLAGKPGVWLLEPGDQRAMRDAIVELAQAKFAGRALSFDRSALAEQLSYDTRAGEFASVVRAAIERRDA
ncbi:MAG: glycosyltransferase [Solirubrobacterales bacterium]